MQLFSITFALHCIGVAPIPLPLPLPPPCPLACALALTSPLSLSRSLSSPIPLRKLLRRTRTIIIKTKMFKIHFLSPLLHPPLISQRAVICLAPSLPRPSSSSSFSSPPRNVSPTAVSLARSLACTRSINQRGDANATKTKLPGTRQWVKSDVTGHTADYVIVVVIFMVYSGNFRAHFFTIAIDF